MELIVNLYFFRLIAFLEAKRKKAEEEGLEPVSELPEGALADMTDEQLAAHLAGVTAQGNAQGVTQDQDGSVCQSEGSNPTNSSSTNHLNNNTTTSSLPTDSPDSTEPKHDADELTHGEACLLPSDR